MTPTSLDIVVRNNTGAARRRRDAVLPGVAEQHAAAAGAGLRGGDRAAGGEPDAPGAAAGGGAAVVLRGGGATDVPAEPGAGGGGAVGDERGGRQLRAEMGVLRVHAQRGGAVRQRVVRGLCGGAGVAAAGERGGGGGVLFPGLFEGYYRPYVEAVWDKYAEEDLVVQTQFGGWGEFTGRVDGDGRLTFSRRRSEGEHEEEEEEQQPAPCFSFGQPSAADIFSCASGPFAGGAGVSGEQLNVGARVAAALNRSTLLANARQPEGERVSEYYCCGGGGGAGGGGGGGGGGGITNHYARICHETSVGGKGYAFPYDDVGASGGGEEDQSGFLSDADPRLLTVGVGGPL